ncbi:thioredoxin [Candidatus Thiodiazotropha endoloripes]|uniref:DsbA family protein n=1 Tax=Candidatus Thiodiazotropha endoloripes TaxID=1818881 RepID=UPI00083E1CF4|nr:DsbA family protein [Candidatus Thiodiazotropha endoloripes]ODB86363.1 thioredoxin [Candidatus Thiodiazotropha endoloripes]ODB88394.1 thioredoxin [Candidatus Thiodiazotropha endoloripes]
MSLKRQLYYIHDPMCSWCWAFRPTLHRLLNNLPSEISSRYLLGGLAPDSDLPMDVNLRRKIEGTWKTIQSKIPGTDFNYDFWRKNTPRRSTYPACRSVIAAREIDSSKEDEMIYAIQQAYYLNAMNPSDYHTLENLAMNIGINGSQFSKVFRSDVTANQLHKEIGQCRTMGVYSFPSLVLEIDGSYWPIPIDYNDANTILESIFDISS